MLSALFQSFLRDPGTSLRVLRSLPAVRQGLTRGRAWSRPADGFATKMALEMRSNPLREYFESHHSGRGIWKWLHYFDVYHHHLNKFIGKEVHVVEVGVYSGGSLDMWKSYFGSACRVYGVDIEPACRVYEDGMTQIFIGDQADRSFWKRFRDEIPTVDILIDDGSHRPEQQIVTLEEMLPHLRPGGVYICEDVLGTYQQFAPYLCGLAQNLNAFHQEGSAVTATTFQATIRSIHLYPFIAVLEKTDQLVGCFVDRKHGTEWQPFL